MILVVSAIAALILAIIRRKRHKEKNAIVAFIWFGAIVFLFALLQVSLWYFIPVLPLAKTIAGILVFITLLIYAFKGCHIVSRRWAFFWVLILLQVAYMLFESFLNGDFTLAKGIILMVVHIGFLTAAFIWLWHRKNAQGTEPEAAD